MKFENVYKRAEEGPHQCPCCFNRTLNERGGFDICAVCFWEDDGQDNHDADVVRGGPNGGLSLTVARSNYQAFGACEQSAAVSLRVFRHSGRSGSSEALLKTFVHLGEVS